MSAASKEFFDVIAQDDCRGLDFTDWLAVVAGPTLPKGNDMNIYDAFPSKYLRCADLQGRTIRAVVANVVTEQMGKDMKPVIYFSGKQKGLVINKTKAMLLADAWGPETPNWLGREVSLRPDKALFEGKVTDAIAIAPVYEPAGAPSAPALQAPPQEWRQNAPSAPVATVTHDAGFIDSDVPF